MTTQLSFRPLSVAALFALCPTLVQGCGSDEFTTETGGASGGSNNGSGGNEASSGGTSSGGACSEGPLRFRVTTFEPERNCAPSAGCGNTWLTISPPGGEPLVLEKECALECESCEVPSCSEASCEAIPFVDELTFTWTGAHFGESTCGGGSKCQEAQCAEPGEYTAEFCLERASPGLNTADSCTPNGSVECFEVDFTWPFRGEELVEIGTPPP